MEMDAEFWSTLDELLAAATVILFRPMGIKHPSNSNILLEVQCGTLMDTSAPGKPGIDVWRGTDPTGKLDAALYVMDMVRREPRVKILIGCSEREKEAVQHYLSSSTRKCILIRRT